MVKHLFMIIKKNKQVNLTRITNPHDAIVRHYIDSLLFVKAFEDSHCLSAYPSDSLQFLDLGTGAGFPGIPFSIVTMMNGLLIDDLNALANEIPTVDLETTVVAALVAAGLCSSNGEARRLIQNNAISVNGAKIAGDMPLTETSLIKKGKNDFLLVK